jgi:hypothetical protein
MGNGKGVIMVGWGEVDIWEEVADTEEDGNRGLERLERWVEVDIWAVVAGAEGDRVGIGVDRIGPKKDLECLAT